LYGKSGFNQTKHMLPRLLQNVKYRRQPLSIRVYIGILCFKNHRSCTHRNHLMIPTEISYTCTC